MIQGGGPDRTLVKTAWTAGLASKEAIAKLKRQPAGKASAAVWTFDATGAFNRIPRVRAMDNAAIENAEKAGFDLSLVDASLRLTPEERARQHDQALALVLEFDRIRQLRSEEPQSTTPAAR